jgi:antitoxin HicB
MKKKNIGSSFDDWLREEGIYEETTAVAIKRVLARQTGQKAVQQSPKSDPPNRDSTSRRKTRIA